MPEDGGIKNENKTVGTQGEPSKYDNPRYAVSVFIPQTFIEEYRANEKQNRAFEKRRYRLEKWALLVAAIYAALTYGLWRNAKGALEQTRAQVSAAVDAANAAKTQAQAAQAANLESDAQFRLSERPWVDITDVRAKGPLVFDSAKSAHIDVEVTTANGGRSAAVNEGSALDLVMSVGNVAVDRESWNSCNPASAHAFIQGDAVLLPNIPFLSQWRLHTVNEAATPPTRDGQYGIYIAACFGYSDQFGANFIERRLWVFVTTDDQQLFLPQGSIQGHFERAPSGEAFF